jgi:uncharacterized membrane protein
MSQFNRPRAAGINAPAYARYNRTFTKAGVKLDTFNVALGALKALYGNQAAWAAIREARKKTKRKNPR